MTFDVKIITYDIVLINLETKASKVLAKNCARFGNVGDEDHRMSNYIMVL